MKLSKIYYGSRRMKKCIVSHITSLYIRNVYPALYEDITILSVCLSVEKKNILRTRSVESPPNEIEIIFAVTDT